MPDSPFDDSFSLEKFYTQSSDRHHHSEKISIRVPGDWLHFGAMVANNPHAQHYETISDIFRDGFAKALKVTLDEINDPDFIAQWNVHLSIAQREAQKARDDSEMRLVEIWTEQLRETHGWTVDEFESDLAGMQNPTARLQMDLLAQRHQLS